MTAQAQARLIWLAGGLACRDMWRDVRMTLCLLVGVAAVVAPLLVLFGLRYGVVEGLRDELRRNPSSLELRPLTQGRFDEAFFTSLREQPGIAYLEPTPRYLATILSLTSDRQPAGTEPVQVDMLPSRAGDPLLSGLATGAPPRDGIILSKPAAERLHVGAGDLVQARIARIYAEQRQEVNLPLRVLAVLPLDRIRREAALMAPEFVVASENYLEGRNSSLFTNAGEAFAEPRRFFASFRLYAADIDAVEPLRAWLVGQGLQVDTAAGEIRMVQRLDRALQMLFTVVAGLGGFGAALGLAVSLWGNVERKRHELGVMRLIGFPSAAMAAFPLVQAVLITLGGLALSVGVALAAGGMVERILSGTLAEGWVAYRLPLDAVLVTASMAVLAALASAFMAGLAATRLDPAETMRTL
ncbi:ABC transporter permease [Magnetospirillum fulvum]|uniref:Putative ABC transport system permease protein n=1 Tax=Magnetospirillum fulvum TaxID=1082 RepID=A0A1H6GSA4_MAGFU|nr:FtsX-like permease family protein [Magnetospirillum fulvum]SEH25672.1 putative ABC transport system permease protein [Magnetospirillum fulvum]